MKKHECSNSAKMIDSCNLKKKTYFNKKLKKCYCQITACFDKSYCFKAEKETTDLKTTDTCCCDSSSSDSDECSKNACCNDSSFYFKEKVSTFDKFNEQAADHLDIEKGIIFLEHVILNVQELMCVGCEIKLFRSLHSISEVCNLCISLVLLQAEFNLDKKIDLIVEVIKSVKTTTGFTCQQLSSEEQEINIIVNDDAKTFAEHKYSDRVTQMVASDKQTIQITYDIKVIRVRALLKKCFDSSLKLITSQEFSELESKKKHI